MARTIRLLYRGMQGRVRVNFNWNIDPPISPESVIFMSAAEADQTIMQVDGGSTFRLGDADIYITNVSPHNGGVEFILHVDWNSALDVLVDLTVADRYEEWFDAT